VIILSDENKKWVDGFWEKLQNKLSKTAVTIRDFIPYTVENGKYVESPMEGITWWTNGFFGGLMWLMYNATKSEEYKNTALIQEKLLDKAFLNYDGLHHDVGFMWGLTSKANYILTGDKSARTKALIAANILAGRANIKGRYIRAWNHQLSYSIIDCMMNIPLLYWASRELNDDRFKYIAEMHADMTIKHHIRDNGSVAHIVVHKEECEEIECVLAGQGCGENSSWTRGQAWGVYGFILSYIHTGEKKYLDACKKVSDNFVKRAEEYNFEIPADFDQKKEDTHKDTSAAVCAVCGLIELYKATDEEKYLEAAIKILKALEKDCVFDGSNQAILQNGMESYSSGIQRHLIYSDFFLAEAILKLKNSDFLIW
jgi:unsaturated chondroitin disaccharide hydrolase